MVGAILAVRPGGAPGGGTRRPPYRAGAAPPTRAPVLGPGGVSLSLAGCGRASPAAAGLLVASAAVAAAAGHSRRRKAGLYSARRVAVVAHAGGEALDTAVDAVRDSLFCSVYCVDLLSPCRSLNQVEEACGFECEVEPAQVPEWIRDLDREEFVYELDAWFRWEPPSEFADYYDLRSSPEGYTGYDGSDVWKFVHSRLEFPEASSGTMEASLNGALSGLHASINAHIVNDLVERAARGDAVEGKDGSAEFARRLAQRSDAIQALRDSFALTLLAVKEASEQLLSYDYGEESDAILPAVQTFVEAAEEEENQLSEGSIKEALANCRLRTRELCSVMDCVQCNACRIHGKVAGLGIAAAFHAAFGAQSTGKAPELSRIEVAALLATLAKFRNAVRIVDSMAKA
mmetsp:Transcript_19960/g.43560  ORF Transcript_19960/g.43560 Transcript_19960/m.43560 type:complete len:402 (-) Transcript_19960:271-1476(-)|eukprot:CAMPEP_0170583888 /NCGR_PEP_ID=MMETSP0224-20130122/8387_1 /TAXON_ID=285029 /ORGANISM="Togula jolla, Strain CCCM 725" /LENGTH=401 /DNA_ID=CAMNT_0010907269 /DNA_START=1 /DNA_END=1206 /DNA_ORIENTATION=+